MAAAANAAGPYDITWSTVDAGGGQSAGGTYAISGTIGQPDAAISTGERFIVQGGFWTEAEAPLPERAPRLRIVHNGANIILAWPNPSTGFEPEFSGSLPAPVWNAVSETPTVVGSEKQIMLTIQPGQEFFRLRRP